MHSQYFDPEFVPDMTPIEAPTGIGHEKQNVPQAILFDIAIHAAATQFDQKILEVIDPRADTAESLAAHTVLVAYLGRTSIKRQAIVDELGFKSVSELEERLDIAELAIETDPELESRMYSYQTQVRRALPPVESEHLPVTVKRSAHGSTEPEVVVPAMADEERRLFLDARGGDENALATLRQAHGPSVDNLIDALSADVPDEVIEVAWKVFDTLIKSYDVMSSSPFDITLKNEINVAIHTCIEAYVVQSNIEKTDMNKYHEAVTAFIQKQGKKLPKTSLDSREVTRINAIADEYVTERLAQGAGQPFSGFDLIKPGSHREVRLKIRDTHKAALKKCIRASVLMAEQGHATFHIGQFSEPKLREFFAMTLDTIATTELAKKKYHRS